jgi:small GTP-binding protein
MKENYTNYDNLIKIVIIGDSGVGKSNYLYRFVEGEFCPVHEATIGFDYKYKISILPNSKKKVKFQIWDTAGQEKYVSINKNLFQRVEGIILMYDISEPKSFYNLDMWMKLIRENANELPLILIGNKIDLIQERKITKEKGEKFANDNNMKFFESSGKSGENVEDSFIFLAEQIIQKKNIEDVQSVGDYVISKDTVYKKNKKKCC